jgi:hypothetical protein
MGHTVRLMAPQFVKPSAKTNKNVVADAEAICEAVARPNMRSVRLGDPVIHSLEPSAARMATRSSAVKPVSTAKRGQCNRFNTLAIAGFSTFIVVRFFLVRPAAYQCPLLRRNPMPPALLQSVLPSVLRNAAKSETAQPPELRSGARSGPPDGPSGGSCAGHAPCPRQEIRSR